MTAEHRTYLPPPPGGGNQLTTAASENNELWPQGRGDMPQIKAINVKCEKNHMKVNVDFDRPFYGMVFSKGHYSDTKCIHLAAGSGTLSANFDIYLGGCGMTSSDTAVSPANPGQGTGLYTENTIIIQYDPQVQEIWDQARRLRCTWYDYYEKAVTFRSFNVDMMEAVTANFLGDNIQCWMQIQAGKGPWAGEVAGIVKIGQTMTMVLAIKDDENRFDMLVRNCHAHDGKHQPIQLVDENGCVIRPKIMSRFQKIKNFGHSATVVSYAYFQAFKFPDSMNVHFQCVIQVCRHECPEPVCEGGNDFIAPPAEPSRPVAAAASNRVPVYRPAPSTPASPFPQKFMQRSGDLEDNKMINLKADYAIEKTGGMPRALRQRRETGEKVSDQFKNIEVTEKVIQVVSPGDVAFALPMMDDNATTMDISSSRFNNDNTVCVSTIGLTAGLVLVLMLLVVSSLVAGFLFLRVRQINKMAIKCTESAMAADRPEFFKIPGFAAIELAGR
ncbi:hypothetical protein HDE_11339 [Halotydeus destructor]|nr:hypothetical protein HDE_11339 [Halotydeus destructor]